MRLTVRLPILLAIGGLSAVLSARSQETLIKQNFDQMPENFVGRFGQGTDGRWMEFGRSPGTPRIQSGKARKGNAVELTRVEGASQHALLGTFAPILQAHRILLECRILLENANSGAIVALARGNDLAAGLLLSGEPSRIRGWNGQTGKWEPVSSAPLPAEWCRIAIAINVEAATYEAAVFSADGSEIVRQQFPFDVSLLSESGIGVLLVNPQQPEPFYLDDVSLHVER